LSHARIVETRGERVTVAIKLDAVSDYTMHAGELLLTLDTHAASDLGVAISAEAWDAGERAGVDSMMPGNTASRTPNPYRNPA
jgi:hypothetical protein